MPRRRCPSGADVVIVGGGAVGRQRRVPPRRGRRGGRAARARPARQRLDVEGRGRPARAVLGRAEHRDRQAQPRRPTSTSPQRPGWEIDYEEIGYLFVLTTEAEVEAFTRSVALQNELGVPSRMITPEEALRDLPAARGRGHPRRQLLPDRRARHARVGGAGLRVRRARARRAHRRVHAGRGRSTCATASITRRAHAARARSPRARSSAPRAPGRARAGRWSASRSTSRRCAARCCSPRRWPTCRPSSR